ncbi:MAG: TolC family protein [Sulfuricurvum sp.]|jgi:outer membrane protein TolC|uniref:TolC family protein n=1 Tax=Sulfuricurvum sp. TaxID=2025608 RepID=UPI0025FAF16D|nr:TolC family protein [Sulfuricurvum sp.]MCK9371581.1 TolC family protein [Sulfuricurvum sp.]
MRQEIAVSLAALLVVSGCSTLSQQEVFDSMNQMTATRGAEPLIWLKTSRDVDEAKMRVDALLKEPLNEANAVRITLINNRTLQQTYEQIGIAQSDLVQAGLMTNPLLGYSIGHGGGVRTSGMTLELAFLDLLWIPLRKELGGLALEETKLSVGDEVLRTVRDAKKIYIDAQVAQEAVRLNRDVLKSHEASVQLAIRQYTAGNLSKRDFLKIQDEYSRTRLESIRLNRENAIAREALTKMMGLYAEQTDYKLDTKGLMLSAPFPKSEGLERLALKNRLDIAAAMKAVEYAAKEAGYTENTRLLSEVTVEGGGEKSTDSARFTTIGIKIPIPMFDMGEARLSRTQALYNRSVQRLYAIAVNVRSQTREAYAQSRYAYDGADEYQSAIVKVNQNIMEETQRYYNGMLDGIYELLADQRRYSEAKIGAVNAIGEYQKTEADLVYVLGGAYHATK